MASGKTFAALALYCTQTIRDSPADKMLEIAVHYGCLYRWAPDRRLDLLGLGSY
jgi:hypothetical protein